MPPQLENGFTRIANELLEAVYRYPFSPHEFRVLLAVMRQSYGWARKECPSSLTMLSKQTGLDRPKASRARKSLIEIGAIVETTSPEGVFLQVQKDYSKWGGVLKQQRGCRNSNGVAGTATGGVAETATKGVAETATKGVAETATKGVAETATLSIKKDLKIGLKKNTTPAQGAGGAGASLPEEHPPSPSSPEEDTAQAEGETTPFRKAKIPPARLPGPKDELDRLVADLQSLHAQIHPGTSQDAVRKKGKATWRKLMRDLLDAGMVPGDLVSAFQKFLLQDNAPGHPIHFFVSRLSGLLSDPPLAKGSSAVSHHPLSVSLQDEKARLYPDTTRASNEKDLLALDGIVQSLLDEGKPEEKIREVALNFLADRDPFTVKTGHSWAYFEKNFGKYGTTPRAQQGRRINSLAWHSTGTPQFDSLTSPNRGTPEVD